jgi:hypothetical protein
MPARLPALRGPVRPRHLWALATLSIVTFAALFPSPTLAAPTQGLLDNAGPDAGYSDEDDYNRIVREAWARIADPVEPWSMSYVKAAAEPDTGWISHWFSMGGEGTLTVYVSVAG